MCSTAQWLSWQTGVGLGAGREQVRVARALRDLPLIAAEFAAGRLSYSKVRALTRFASAATESDLVGFAEHATGAQIERFAAGARRAKRGGDVRARRNAAHLRWHQDEDGSIVGSFRLAPEQAAVFCQALDAATGRIQDVAAEEDPDVDPGAGRARCAAEALGAIAETYLESVSAETSPERAERYQLILHTTAAELANADDAERVDGPGNQIVGWNGRAWRVAPSTARRLTCDCPASTMTDHPDGAALHLGRKTRRIRGRLRRAVHARDRGMCRAPGCTDRATQIHHVRHWVHGGSTCLPNLISLCDRHHWLVHEGGFTLVPRDDGWRLLSLNGVRIGPTPQPHEPTEELPTDPDITHDAVTGHWDGSRLDVDDAVRYLLRVEPLPRPTKAAEPCDDDEDVSAETWGPIDWPVHDDYPGQPWIGYDDPFAAW